MLHAGSIGLLGLGLQQTGLLRALGEANVNVNGPRPRAKSVIFIFLSGGLSQIDTFDMKPEASEEIRGEFKPIATRTPGLRICEHLPMLARCSHLWGLCRSISHDSNDHSQGHHIMLTGRSELPVGFSPNKPTPSDWPSMAALANKTLVPRANLPPSIVLPEKIIHRTGRVIPGQFSGMLEDTLVVMASEFGRTPRIFKLPNVSLPGRDHWGAAQTAFFAGGGVTGGAVVGSTDPLGAYPASDPQRPEDFAATIYHALGIPPHTTWNDMSGRPHHIYHGQPIAELFG